MSGLTLPAPLICQLSSASQCINLERVRPEEGTPYSPLFHSPLFFSLSFLCLTPSFLSIHHIPSSLCLRLSLPLLSPACNAFCSSCLLCTASHLHHRTALWTMAAPLYFVFPSPLPFSPPLPPSFLLDICVASGTCRLLVYSFTSRHGFTIKLSLGVDSRHFSFFLGGGAYGAAERRLMVQVKTR